jgi:hypothetical protein
VERKVEGHVAGCAECREELEALRELDATLAGEGQVDPPKGMAAEVARRAAARAMVRRRVMVPRWLEALTLAGTSAAGAAVGLVGAWVVGLTAAMGQGVGVLVAVVGAAVAVAMVGTQYYES